MTTLYGPHIPYKDNAYKGLKPKEEWLNWLEVERWAARLSEQMGGFNWNASLRHDGGSVVIVGPATGTRLNNGVVAWHSTDDPGFSLNYNQDVLGSGTWAIVVPRDGVYSVSASVGVFSSDPGLAEVTIITNKDEHPTDIRSFMDLGGGLYNASFTPNCDGMPLNTGDVIWLEASLYSTTTATFVVNHLSVTYEAELGPFNPRTNNS